MRERGGYEVEMTNDSTEKPWYNYGVFDKAYLLLIRDDRSLLILCEEL